MRAASGKCVMRWTHSLTECPYMWGGTFAVECCFQKAADHADRDNANRRLDGRKLWHTPIHEKMLSKLFRVQEVDLA